MWFRKPSVKSKNTVCFGTPVERSDKKYDAHLKQAKCALLLLVLVSLDDKVVLESTMVQLLVCRYHWYLAAASCTADHHHTGILFAAYTGILYCSYLVYR